MTTRSVTPLEIAPRVLIALHELITGPDRQVAFRSVLSVVGRRLRSPANRIH